MRLSSRLVFVLALCACAAPERSTPSLGAQPAAASAVPQAAPSKAGQIRALYDKREVLVPMRDGVKLFTAIYTPKSHAQPFPILLRRTPYSCRPYGADQFPETPGPTDLFTDAGYAFAIQDVRGCYMSEGEFVDVRPQRAVHRSSADFDESTDAWDTVDWLVKHVAGHNGRIGMWGISYPGFYAAAGMIDAHPALAAVSPQAPIADWWWDDFHHNGALFLPHAFLFLNGFGRPRPVPVKERAWSFDAHTPDGWDFFLRLGSLANADARHFHGDVRFWDELMAHPDRDAFWKARDLRPHLDHVAPAVLTVGGWFDAEDLFGPLAIHREIARRNPGVVNALVMGPWAHGGWARTDGDQLGQARFGAKTALFFREQIEKRFFDRYLRGVGDWAPPAATMFETGANRWRTFDAWPPHGLRERRLVLAAGGKLDIADQARSEESSDAFVSDPRKPVPHTQAIEIGMNKEYMAEDQRFAERRPDVLTYTSEPLAEDLTIAGPMQVELRVATSSTDADWIVKLVDIFPGDEPDPEDPPLAAGQRMGGYAMLVRGDVMPGRFREGFEMPKAFVPDRPTDVHFTLWDVLHTFRKGHRVEVQVQSTWFPLVARNPQTFVANPYAAREQDYVAATHRVFHGSSLTVGVLAPQP